MNNDEISALTTIRTYSDPAAAHIARTILQDNGIEAHLFDENCNALRYYSVPVRLLVQDDMADTALNLLKSAFPALPEDFEVQ